MSLFVELIQVAFGTRTVLSRIPSEDDWLQIYDTAAKQSLVGIVLSGIEIIRTKNVELSVPKILLLQWIGEVQMIEQQNKKLNEAAEHLTRIFKNGGLRSCVLKGQGVARLYDGALSLRRQPGDIDLWVEGGREKVLQFLKSSYLKIGTVVIHHVDASIVDVVETEVHFLPSYSYNYLRYIKYKQFFYFLLYQQFDHFDEQVGFAYPPNRFNHVYLMMHIFRHVYH